MRRGAYGQEVLIPRPLIRGIGRTVSTSPIIICRVAHGRWRYTVKDLGACVNACWVYPVVRASQMYLYLSVIFFTFFCNIWGWMCWTVPLKFRWSRGYICNSYYYHQIRSINDFHCCHIFRGYVWAGCTSIFCQFCFCFQYNCAVYDACKYPDTLKSEGRICLFTHYTLYRHYADKYEGTDIKCLLGIFCRVYV